MRLYFFDSYAIVEVFVGNAGYSRFGDEVFFTTSLNLAEAYNAFLRFGKETEFFHLVEKTPIDLLEITPDAGFEAVRLRRQNAGKRLSLVDCIGYVLAEKNNFRFLTGDKEFESMPNVEFVK